MVKALVRVICGNDTGEVYKYRHCRRFIALLYLHLRGGHVNVCSPNLLLVVFVVKYFCFIRVSRSIFGFICDMKGIFFDFSPFSRLSAAAVYI